MDNKIDKKYILNILNDKKSEINKIFGVNKIGLFGSFIYDEQKDSSDIDILVEFNSKEETFDNYMDLKFYLEELFNRKVDLIIERSVKKRIKDKILKETIYA